MREDLGAVPHVRIERVMRWIFARRTALPLVVIPHPIVGWNHKDAIAVTPVRLAGAPETDAKMIRVADETGFQRQAKIGIFAVGENQLAFGGIGHTVDGAV